MKASKNARASILAKLRAAPNIDVAAPVIAPALLEKLTLAGPATDIERFEASLTAAHAEVIKCKQSEWRKVLATVCTDKKLNRLSGDDEIVELTGGELPSSAGQTHIIRSLKGDIVAFKSALFDATDAGICLANCAFADTGTLVLRSSPKQARTLSLVPPVNICLVSENRMYPTLLAAMAAEKWQSAMPSNLVFISGPSKTADIQQTLAYGAHGPSQLVVIVVTDGAVE